MLSISHEIFEDLGFDLSSAVESFYAEVIAHRSTVNVPAPTAHPLVEAIVRQHGGQFSVEPHVEPPVEPPVEPDPPTPAVPVSITPRQCRLVLLQSGILDKVEAAIALQPRAVQLSWEYASEFRRDDPLLLHLAGPDAMNLSSEQLDQFFIAASKL